MSVFSMIKKGRQAAKDHKAEQAEKQKQEAAKPTYKHVPTHAAVDAMAGAPSGWREDDRYKIMEQNRRRSAMAASGMGSMVGVGMNPVHMGMPRVNSALSHVSYPSMYANPVVHTMSRAYSYNGSLLPAWEEHGSEVVYSHHPEGPNGHVGGSGPPSFVGKGKGIERTSAAMANSGRGSCTSSKAPSPVGSSSNSTTSQDDLEMKTVKHAKGDGSNCPTASSPATAAAAVVAAVTAQDARPSSRSSTDPDPVHRLHPSQTRRTSDPPPTDRYYPPRANYRQPHLAGVPRPGSGSKASSGIPPVPALPPMSFGPSVTSSAASTASSRAPSVRNSPGVSPSVTLTSNSSVSTATSTPKAAAPQPESPVSAPAESPRSAVSAVSAVIIPEPKFDFEFTSTPPANTALRELPPLRTAIATPRSVPQPEPEPQVRLQQQQQQMMTSRQVKSARFSEVEAFEPNAFELRKAGTRTTISASNLPTDFDEAALSAIRETGSSTTTDQKPRGKLTKSSKVSPPAAQGGAVKPAKKNRWSLRSKSTPVAG